MLPQNEQEGLEVRMAKNNILEIIGDLSLNKNIPSSDKLVKMVRDKLDDMQKDIDYWKNQCKALKDEHWKDDKLAEMKEERDKAIKEKHLGFYMTEEERDAIRAWKEKHVKEKHNGHYYGGSIGGTYTYIFTPTSIGTAGDIRCSCGEEFCFREL